MRRATSVDTNVALVGGLQGVFNASNVNGRNITDVDIAEGAYAGWDLSGGAEEYGPDWRESHIEVFEGGGELN